MRAPKTSLILTVCGLVLLAIGFITLLSAVGHFRALGTVPWLLLAYAGMDFILGAGFCMQEKWILPLLGLNLCGYAFLHLVSLLLALPAHPLYMGVNILLAAALWGVVYRLKPHLVETGWGRVEVVAFALLWAFTYIAVFFSLL